MNKSFTIDVLTTDAENYRATVTLLTLPATWKVTQKNNEKVYSSSSGTFVDPGVKLSMRDGTDAEIGTLQIKLATVKVNQTGNGWASTGGNLQWTVKSIKDL